MTHNGFALPVKISLCAAGLWLFQPINALAQAETGNQSRPPAYPYPVVMPGPSYVNTGDLAIPSAQEIVVDVPNAIHWSRYQRGVINDWRYLMFPDGSAKIMRDGDDETLNPPLAALVVTCKAGVSCDIVRADGSHFIVPAIGAPRPNLPENVDGEALARYLAEWMLAGTGTPIVAPDPAPSPPKSLPASLALPEEGGAELVQATDTADSGSNTEDDLVAQAQTDLSTVAAPSPTDEIAQPEPVCSEQEPFLPTACAQPTTPIARPARQLRNALLARPKPSVIALPLPAEAPAPESLFDRIDLACSITGSTSLGVAKKGGAGRSTGKPRASLGCSAKLTEKLSLRVSVLKYANAKDRASDDPDFTYAFSYRYSEKITFSYSNYSATFGGAQGDFLKSLTSGNFRGSYKLPSIPLPNQQRSACSASIGLPNPMDTSVNLSCGYAITEKFRIGGTANLYFANAQDSYDPDYSYTASYRPSKDWLISYSNYSNNRWPWNRGPNPGPGFEGGSISVTYSLKF